MHIQRRTLNDFDNTYSEDNVHLDGSTSALASSSVLNKHHHHHLQTRHQQLYRLRAPLHVHLQLLDVVSSTREVLGWHFRKRFNVPTVVLKRRGKKDSYKNGQHTPFFPDTSMLRLPVSGSLQSPSSPWEISPIKNALVLLMTSQSTIVDIHTCFLSTFALYRSKYPERSVRRLLTLSRAYMKVWV